MSDKPSAPKNTKHHNDPYGSFDSADQTTGTPAIPAATVVLLRDTQSGLEVLMLRKTSKISFGGMWVFPGGRIDAGDYPEDRNPDTAARNAAVRETAEEASLELAPEAFVYFAHWTPPPSTPKRFSTWFFVAASTAAAPITVDGGEIDDYQWINPAAALERHAAAEIDLVPPTWVSLFQLSRFANSAEAISALAARGTRHYHTRLAKRADGVRVALWEGDAGYEAFDADADISHHSHRLVMAPGGFEFLHSAADY